MKANKDAIGTLLAYLSKRCKYPYVTNILKLIYIIDEEAVKESGVPITMLEYQVWQYGPVSTDVYYSRIASENRFARFVVSHPKGSGIIFESIIEPDMRIFSEDEKEVIDRVLELHGHKNSDELVSYTHREDGLWYAVKELHHINFEKEGTNTSDHTIDFSWLITDEPDKLENYHCALENAHYMASFT